MDIEPQPKYPFGFVRCDAIAFIKAYGTDYDAIHASPPCQAYSDTQKIMGNDHPELIEPLRAALIATGKPYVIENVPGSPLNNPVELCGMMFGLRLYRHRLFETNWGLVAPPHPKHVKPQVNMGRPAKAHEMIQPVGNFSGVDEARIEMAMPWATRDGLREAIPPAYTEWIGLQLRALLLSGGVHCRFATDLVGGGVDS